MALKNKAIVFGDIPTAVTQLQLNCKLAYKEAIYPEILPFLDTVYYKSNINNISFRKILDIATYLILDHTAINKAEYKLLISNIISHLFDTQLTDYSEFTKVSLLDVISKNKPISTVVLAGVLYPLNKKEILTVEVILSIIILLFAISSKMPSTNNYDKAFLITRCKSYLFRANGLATVLQPEDEISRDVLDSAKWFHINAIALNTYANKLNNSMWTEVHLNRLKYMGLTILLTHATRVATVPFLQETLNKISSTVYNNILTEG